MPDPTPAVFALAEALVRNGIAVENIASMGNAEQWLPDTELAAAILTELQSDPAGAQAVAAELLPVDVGRGYIRTEAVAAALAALREQVNNLYPLYASRGEDSGPNNCYFDGFQEGIEAVLTLLPEPKP